LGEDQKLDNKANGAGGAWALLDLVACTKEDSPVFEAVEAMAPRAAEDLLVAYFKEDLLAVQSDHMEAAAVDLEEGAPPRAAEADRTEAVVAGADEQAKHLPGF
jgi:hypothetical protein